eukprot:2042856-Prymnesium_polylepis.1
MALVSGGRSAESPPIYPTPTCVGSVAGCAQPTCAGGSMAAAASRSMHAAAKWRVASRATWTPCSPTVVPRPRMLWPNRSAAARTT